MSDFAPTASWQNLRLRARLLARARAFFDGRGFLQVETPLLSADTTVEVHVDPIGVVLPDDPRTPEVGRRMWLQTSPEFAMKRMLASAGDEPDAPRAIYQITRAFRAGESGPLHNPEFTILEWYRAGDTMPDGMRLLSELCEDLLETDPAEQLSYREAFGRHAGIDPLMADIPQLAATAAVRNIAAPPNLGDDRDGWLDLLLTELVAPNLGGGRPTILFDYPATQAALAVIRNEDPPVAERFELFHRGIELANGYHELTDPGELRLRFTEANRRRTAAGKPPLPEESRLLSAMTAGLPPCTGAAVGLDRLIMLAAGAKTLENVLPFPLGFA